MGLCHTFSKRAWWKMELSGGTAHQGLPWVALGFKAETLGKISGGLSKGTLGFQSVCQNLRSTPEHCSLCFPTWLCKVRELVSLCLCFMAKVGCWAFVHSLQTNHMCLYCWGLFSKSTDTLSRQKICTENPLSCQHLLCSGMEAGPRSVDPIVPRVAVPGSLSLTQTLCRRGPGWLICVSH